MGQLPQPHIDLRHQVTSNKPVHTCANALTKTPGLFEATWCLRSIKALDRRPLSVDLNA